VPEAATVEGRSRTALMNRHRGRGISSTECFSGRHHNPFGQMTRTLAPVIDLATDRGCNPDLA
jgi:hypothetical protein